VVVAKLPKERADAKLKHPGLRNLGNTCFFNSVMQCLAACTPMGDMMQQHPLQTSCGPLNAAFASVVTQLRTPSTSAVDPSKLHSAICNKWRQFKGYRQQDAHELLRLLMDGLTEEYKKAGHGEDHFVNQCFGGKLVSAVLCDTCYTVLYYRLVERCSCRIVTSRFTTCRFRWLCRQARPFWVAKCRASPSISSKRRGSGPCRHVMSRPSLRRIWTPPWPPWICRVTVSQMVLF
jgi:hypothetical protein